MSSTKKMIRVVFQGPELNQRHQKTVEDILSERFIERGCPEGASVFFYFERMVTKRNAPGIYVNKKKAGCIDITLKSKGSNEAIKGSLKPSKLNGRDMSLSQLEEFLKPVVRRKSIPQRGTDPAKKATDEKVSSGTHKTTQLGPVNKEKEYYARGIIGDDVFLDLVLLAIVDSCENGIFDCGHITAKEVKDHFDKNNLFPDDDKTLHIKVLGKVLSAIAQRGNLKRVNKSRPSIYKVVKKSKKEPVENLKAPLAQEHVKDETDHVGDLVELTQKRDLIESKISDIGSKIEDLKDEQAKLLAERSKIEQALSKYKDLYDSLKSVFE